ncbi:hypothetical protein ACFQH6_19390 [Halobacteriaceae archaeon GCM10025711]
MDLGNVIDYASHPFTGLVGVFAVVSGVLDPFVQLVSATAGLWFPFLSVGSTLAGSIPAIPAGVAEQAFQIGAAVYLLIVGWRLLEAVIGWFRQRQQQT